MRANPIRWLKGLFVPQIAPGVSPQLPPNVRVEMTEVPWGPEEIRRRKRLLWWLFSPALLLLGLVVLKILSLYIGSWVAAAAFNAGNYSLMESAAKIQGIVNVIEPHRALHNLGVAYSMQGRYEEAKEQLDDALWRATPPDVCLIRYDLARTWELEGAQFEAEGDLEQAIRAFDSGKKVLDAQEIECLPPEQESEDESDDESEDQSEDESESAEGEAGEEGSEDEQSEDEQSQDEESESDEEQSEQEQPSDPSDPDQGEEEQSSGGEGEEEQPSGGEGSGEEEQTSGGEQGGEDEGSAGSEGEGQGEQEQPAEGEQGNEDPNESPDGEGSSGGTPEPGEGDQETEVPEAGDGANQDSVNEALQGLLERLTQKLEQLQGQQAGGDEGDEEAEELEPDANGQQELPEVMENQGDRLQQIQDLLDQAWKERSDWDSADRSHNQDYVYTRRPW